jgi:hypothetical protein
LEIVGYLKPLPDGNLSIKAYIEAECRDFRRRILTDSYYSNSMAEGPSGATNNEPEKD